MPKFDPNQTSEFAPAATLHNGDLHVAWLGTDNRYINVLNLTTGQKGFVDGTGVGGVCLTSWDGRLFIAWTGSDAIIRAARSVNGYDNWTPCDLPVVLSKFAPAIGPSRQGSFLSIAWTEPEDGSIKTMFSISGHAFFPHATLAERSLTGPSIAQSGDNATGILWVSTDQRINYVSLQADGTLFAKQTLEERTDATPQIIVVLGPTHRNYGLYCWRGTEGEGQLNVGHYRAGALPPQDFSKSLIGEQSVGGPSLVRKDDQVYVFWTDPGGNLNYKGLL
jgi:hypothetical protein